MHLSGDKEMKGWSQGRVNRCGVPCGPSRGIPHMERRRPDNGAVHLDRSQGFASICEAMVVSGEHYPTLLDTFPVSVSCLQKSRQRYLAIALTLATSAILCACHYFAQRKNLYVKTSYTHSLTLDVTLCINPYTLRCERALRVVL